MLNLKLLQSIKKKRKKNKLAIQAGDFPLFFIEEVMEKLWSTWRSHYIESFKDKTGKESCVFCDALNQDEFSDDSLVVNKGKSSFVIMNLYPYNGGHIMVVPNKHICELDELSSEEFSEITEFIKTITKILKKIMSPHGYNIGANIGRAAGAGIDKHLHFHIVPRWEGDTNFMTSIGEVKVISQDLLDLKNRLQTEFEKL